MHHFVNKMHVITLTHQTLNLYLNLQRLYRSQQMFSKNMSMPTSPAALTATALRDFAIIYNFYNIFLYSWIFISLRSCVNLSLCFFVYSSCRFYAKHVLNFNKPVRFFCATVQI